MAVTSMNHNEEVTGGVPPRLGQEASHLNFPLSVYDLTVAYHRKPVIWDIHFDVPPGILSASWVQMVLARVL